MNDGLVLKQFRTKSGIYFYQRVPERPMTALEMHEASRREWMDAERARHLPHSDAARRHEAACLRYGTLSGPDLALAKACAEDTVSRSSAPTMSRELRGACGEAKAEINRNDSTGRKAIPLCTGVLDYFPDALADVARLSKIGNDKHNPGQPLHWSREKSSDHADCIVRHQAERNEIDPEDGVLHATKVAWRALAQLQVLIEKRRNMGLR